METHHFDRLTRALSEAGPRRGLLGLLAGLPALGGLFALLDPEETDAQGRRHRRKKAHKHGRGRRHKQQKKKKCKPQSKTTTCSGKCGPVTNNCKKTIDCGSCDCPEACGDCEICQSGPDTPGVCVPDPEQNGDGCDDGDLCTTDSICSAGVCGGGTPVVCPATDCQIPGVCDPKSGACTSPGFKPADTPCASQPCGLCNGGGVCVANTACANGEVCCNGECCAGCCGSDGSCGACRVFVTSQKYDGNLKGGSASGLAGADDKCQQLADSVDPPLPGAYKAWLSDSTDSPSTRFRCTAASCSSQGYVLVDGATVVATDWADLTTCPGSGPSGPSDCLDHVIDHTEQNVLIGNQNESWTHTNTNGTAGGTGNVHCVDWSTNASDQSGDYGNPKVGQGDITWTRFGSMPCDSNGARLYCFQQS